MPIEKIISFISGLWPIGAVIVGLLYRLFKRVDHQDYKIQALETRMSENQEKSSAAHKAISDSLKDQLLQVKCTVEAGDNNLSNRLEVLSRQIMDSQTQQQQLNSQVVELRVTNAGLKAKLGEGEG